MNSNAKYLIHFQNELPDDIANPIQIGTNTSGTYNDLKFENDQLKLENAQLHAQLQNMMMISEDASEVRKKHINLKEQSEEVIYIFMVHTIYPSNHSDPVASQIHTLSAALANYYAYKYDYKFLHFIANCNKIS